MRSFGQWIGSAAAILILATIAAASAARAHQAGTPVWSGASDEDCLSLAIYYEARSESEQGQHAVAQVVLNRVRDPNYPDDVCSVVFQGFERRTGCQFSFTCDGSMTRLPRGQAWARARQIAAAALAGRTDPEIGNATHYHTTAIRPYWAPSLTRVATIGAHIFYTRPGGIEPASISFERVEQVVLSASDDMPSGGGRTGVVRVHRGSSTRSR